MTRPQIDIREQKNLPAGRLLVADDRISRQTRLGKTLLKPVLALATWGDKHRFEMQDARDRFDASKQQQPGRAATR